MRDDCGVIQIKVQLSDPAFCCIIVKTRISYLEPRAPERISNCLFKIDFYNTTKHLKGKADI